MNALGFVKLFVADLDAMVSFFAEALGAREVMRLPLEDMDEALLTLGGSAPEVVLMRRHAATELTPGSMHGPVGIMVSDCAGALAACVAAGGRQLMAPVTVPEANSRVAFAATPEGHELELVEPLAAQENV